MIRQLETKIYVFIQMDAGNKIISDGRVREYVFIEAINPEHANQRAKQIGIYFDGQEKGIDRGCDRWEAITENTIYTLNEYNTLEEAKFIYEEDGEILNEDNHIVYLLEDVKNTKDEIKSPEEIEAERLFSICFEEAVRTSVFPQRWVINPKYKEADLKIIFNVIKKYKQ
jgi:hypothetical protein